MKPTRIRHLGVVKGGVKTYTNPELYQQQLLALEGKEFVEIIEERKKDPSLNQHRYYRHAILKSCHESEQFISFNKPDDIHKYYFAPMFLTYTEVITVGKENIEVEITQSMADLSMKEVGVFIERVLAHCAELGIIILDPEQYHLSRR